MCVGGGDFVREGLCPCCKIHRGDYVHVVKFIGDGDYVHVAKFMGGDYVHVYKFEQGGGGSCPGDIVVH